MKFTIKLTDFAAAANAAGSAAPAKSPKEILANLKIEAGPDGVEITGGNLDHFVIARAAADVERSGTVLLNAARLRAFLAAVSDEAVTLTVSGARATLAGRSVQTALLTANPAEYPLLALSGAQRLATLDALRLATAIERTEYSTDPSASKFALGGLALLFGDNALTVVSTDGRRLSSQVTAARCAPQPGTQPEYLVPRDAALLVRRLVGHGEVEILALANALVFRGPQATVYTRQIEGRFPKWRDVLPRTAIAASFDVPAGVLMAAIRAAAVTLDGETCAVRLAVEEGTLRLTTRSSIGESAADIPIAVRGECKPISLTASYANDMVRVLPPDCTAQVEIRGPNDPFVVRTECGMQSVLMPLASD